MKPPSRQKSAKRPDADLNRQINSATVLGTLVRSHKVGDSQNSSPSNRKPSNTFVIGNPPECLRQDSRFNRSAPVGPRAIQGNGSPLKCAGSSTDVKMSPPDKLAGDPRTPIFSPMTNHSPGNPGCFIVHFATKRSEMNIEHTRSSLSCLDPNTWHGCCLNGGCHGH